MIKSNLIGKKVLIKASIGYPYGGQWGIVKVYYNGLYEVAILGGEEHMEFERKEFTVSK